MEKEKKQQINTPTAIIVAGFLVMLAILLTRGGSGATPKDKTLSEQVGVSKTSLAECVKTFDKDAFAKKIEFSVGSAMKGETGAGTPYSIVIGVNGVKSKINGAESYENVKKVIDEVITGKVTTAYTGEVPPIEDGEHILGNPKTAKVTIIEYSDFECPFCARFHPILERIINESNGSIAWVYRQFPLVQIHQHAMERAIASECIAKIKGNDAFWKYGDLLFKLVAPVEAPVDQQL
ncbi:MAG: thioredoxin domain-containing protein [Candidatus Paceibacterota bacterium]